MIEKTATHRGSVKKCEDFEFYFCLNIDRLRKGCDKKSERRSLFGTED